MKGRSTSSPGPECTKRGTESSCTIMLSIRASSQWTSSSSSSSAAGWANCSEYHRNHGCVDPERSTLRFACLVAPRS